MSSHLPGFPGLPIISGLAGSSSVLGQAFTHADRRRQEADNRNRLNIPGFLHPAANAAHLALSPPMLPQPSLLSNSRVLTGGMSGAHSTNENITSAAVGIIGLDNTSGNPPCDGSVAVLNLHHRSTASVPASVASTGGHATHGVSNTVAVVAGAAAVAAATSASGAAGTGASEVRVDASRCPVCFRHFDNRWKLERHARVHTGERPFACAKCTKTFTRKEHLTRHELSHDGDSSKPSSANGTTTETHAAVNALVLYGGAESSEEGTVALVRADGCRCPVCFRHFSDRWKLERHTRVHTGERPFTCGRCGNSFRRKEHLVRHERSHDAPLNARHLPGSSDSGGNACGIDEYRVVEASPATMSGNVALRIDACRCPVCFRHFGDRWKLERHARIHTGERPFTCGRCGKSFTTKEHLVRHETSHGGEKPYSCSVCGKAFTRKDHVDRHFKKTHCRSKYTGL